MIDLSLAISRKFRATLTHKFDDFVLAFEVFCCVIDWNSSEKQCKTNAEVDWICVDAEADQCDHEDVHHSGDVHVHLW